MAEILQFRASRENASKHRGRKSPRSAEIVIFPGVRYERWPTEPMQAERKTSAMVRDALKAAE